MLLQRALQCTRDTLTQVAYMQPTQSKHSCRAYLVTRKLDLPWSGREEAKDLWLIQYIYGQNCI